MSAVLRNRLWTQHHPSHQCTGMVKLRSKLGREAFSGKTMRTTLRRSIGEGSEVRSGGDHKTTDALDWSREAF